jgi:hypothetical protein
MFQTFTIYLLKQASGGQKFLISQPFGRLRRPFFEHGGTDIFKNAILQKALFISETLVQLPDKSLFHCRKAKKSAYLPIFNVAGKAERW